MEPNCVLIVHPYGGFEVRREYSSHWAVLASAPTLERTLQLAAHAVSMDLVIPLTVVP